MSPEVLRGLLTILFGALAGGLTNALAVWMLFHPHTPPRLPGGKPLRFLHGAIPRNHARLAAAVGRTVAGKLLTERDLAELLGRPAVRDAFRRLLLDRVGHLAASGDRTLRQMLGDPEGLAVEQGVEAWVKGAAARLLRWTHSPDFESRFRSALRPAASALARRPIRDLLAPGSEDRFLQMLRSVDPSVLGPGFEDRIGQWSAQGVRRLMEHARQPAVRKRIEHALAGMLEGSIRELPLPQRLAARFLVTDEGIRTWTGGLLEEGEEALLSLLRDPAFRTPLLREVLRSGEPLVRDLLFAITASSWNRIAGTDGEEALLELLIQGIRSEAFGQTLHSGLARIALMALDRTPGDLWGGIPFDQAERVLGVLADRIWSALMEGIPPLLREIDLQARVEEKVLGFPTAELEGLVREVTERELGLIVRLGFVLGGVVGAILVGIHTLIGG